MLCCLDKSRLISMIRLFRLGQFYSSWLTRRMYCQKAYTYAEFCLVSTSLIHTCRQHPSTW